MSMQYISSKLPQFCCFGGYSFGKDPQHSPYLLQVKKNPFFPPVFGLDVSNWLKELRWWLRRVKNLPAMQETQVLSLGQDDPLENEMTNHSSILIWKITWTEEPGGLQSTGSQRVGHD